MSRHTVGNTRPWNIWQVILVTPFVFMVVAAYVAIVLFHDVFRGIFPK